MAFFTAWVQATQGSFHGQQCSNEDLCRSRCEMGDGELLCFLNHINAAQPLEYYNQSQ